MQSRERSSRRARCAVPRDRVAFVETREVSVARSAGAGVGGLVVAFAVLAGVALMYGPESVRMSCSPTLVRGRRVPRRAAFVDAERPDHGPTSFSHSRYVR